MVTVDIKHYVSNTQIASVFMYFLWEGLLLLKIQGTQYLPMNCNSLVLFTTSVNPTVQYMDVFND